MEGVVINREFWKNRRVFLSGHTGFKGSWLSLLLTKLGANIYGYSLDPPTQPSLFESAKLAACFETEYREDIRDAKMVRKAILDSSPEVVIHMAAQPLVTQGYNHPVETFETNIMGTVALLEACRSSETAKFVLIVTSDKCYRIDDTTSGYVEQDRLGGPDPYSNSKSCAELVTESYRESYLADLSIQVATARAGNVIGGGDWAQNRLIPDAIRAFTSNQPFILRNPDAIRPWQHVLEPLCGYLQVCEYLAGDGYDAASAWNFGPQLEDTRPVSVLADYLANAWGADARWQIGDPSPFQETNFLYLDATKAMTLLSWRPLWDLKKTLQQTIDWYQLWHQGGDAAEICNQQIDAYLAGVSGQ